MLEGILFNNSIIIDSLIKIKSFLISNTKILFCRNICHGSDSVESAKKEINLWFTEKEQVSWTSASENWVYE